MIKRKSGQRTCIVQAWQYMRTLGEVLVKFDKNGKLVSCKGDPELLLGSQGIVTKKNSKYVSLNKKEMKKVQKIVEEDPKLQFVLENKKALEFIAPYKKAKLDFGGKKIAYLNQDYTHSRKANVKNGDKFRNESKMAQLVADSYLAKARSFDSSISASLVNGGGVRSDILAGHVTVDHVYEVLPFGNELYVFEIKGRDIKPLIEEALNGHGGLPAFSGLDVVFKKSKGKLYIEKLSFIKGGKKIKIEPNKSYKLVTIDFLFKGGDGYDFSKAKLQLKSGILDNEAFYDYLVKHHSKK